MNVINTGILSMALDLAPSKNSIEGGKSPAKRKQNVSRIDFQNFEKTLRSEILKFTRISEEDISREEHNSGMKIASFLGIKLI